MGGSNCGLNGGEVSGPGIGIGPGIRGRSGAGVWGVLGAGSVFGFEGDGAPGVAGSVLGLGPGPG